MFGWRSVSDFLLHGLFIGGFVVTIGFFAVVDVYDEHFFQQSYAAPYNAFRVVFAVYFFWLIYVVGRQALSFIGQDVFAGLRLHERLALAFFVGTTVLTAVMLVLGYAGLYWRAVAWAIAVPIVALSYRHFAHTLHEAGSAVARLFTNGSGIDRALSVVMAIATVFAGTALLLVKGLYPQGGHDYYQHYSHYYAAVIDSHGIWPNLFWYQYYVSKSLGVTFLSMLLTDALASSLVTYCFVVAAALALYGLVRDFCSATLWPWLAVVLYLALNVHTLGTGDYAANGGWGHFQKPHELNSPLLFAVLWMSVNMVRSAGEQRRVWWFGAAACAFALAYVLLVSPLIVGLFATFAGLYFLPRSRELARMFLGIAAMAGLGLGSLLLLNYLTTGAPADLAPQALWPIVDLRRLNDEGMLFDFVNIAIVRARGAVDGSALTDDFELIEYVRNVFRIDILGFLVGAALVGVLACMIRRDVLRRRRVGNADVVDDVSRRAGGVIAAFFLATVAFGSSLGLLESISFVRISSFVFPLVIAIAAIVGQVVSLSFGPTGRGRMLVAAILPILLMIVVLTQAYVQQRASLLAVANNALRFADGRYSIYDAYRDQAGWPALPDKTAIYPAMYEAWKKIGPGKRIWSFHIQSYCMLPGCHVESMPASSMTKHREEILFGSPQTAARILQSEGLDHFFISTQMPIRDTLQCTALFSPDTIQDHFDVVWSDGRDVLLTWKGSGNDRLSDEWVEKYRTAVRPNRYVADCSDDASNFGVIGRRVANELAKGKRWGAEVRLPK